MSEQIECANDLCKRAIDAEGAYHVKEIPFGCRGHDTSGVVAVCDEDCADAYTREEEESFRVAACMDAEDRYYSEYDG